MCDETVIKFGKWALSILIVLYIGFYGIYFGFYVYQLSCWENLKDSIDLLISNKNAYSIEEYLEMLKRARDSMAQCHLL